MDEESACGVLEAAAPEMAGPTIMEVFADTVTTHGQRRAIIDRGRVITYQTLDRLVAHNAARLTVAGARRGDRIGISLERSAEAIIAMLAILRIGAAYVPFDPQAPADRIARQAADAGIALSFGTRIEAVSEIRRLDVETDAQDALTPEALKPPAHPLEIAYVIYTSGSSGEPKGVETTHRAVVNLIRGADYCPFSCEDVVFHGMSNAFDGATFEIWGALLSGATLLIAPPRFSIADIADLAQTFGVTILLLTTGLFNAMRASDFSRLGKVRVMLAGGDVMAPAAAQEYLESGPGSLVNGYGPTETTTFSHCWEMRDPAEATAPIPIGRVVPGAGALLLSDEGDQIQGADAHLVVTGLGIAQGYLGRPGRTAERFLPDPFGAPGARMYLTGDLAESSEGVFRFVGRADEQVKISGFRVEPGEIEHAIVAGSQVEECCVLHLAGKLHAFCAPQKAAANEQALRGHLSRGLAAYMMPSTFQWLDRLPLTLNGKIDRARLAKMLDRAKMEIMEHREQVAEDPGLLAIISHVMQRRVRLDDNLIEFGCSSLDIIKICSEIDRQFGKKLPLDSVMLSDSVAEVMALLSA